MERVLFTIEGTLADGRHKNRILADAQDMLEELIGKLTATHEGLVLTASAKAFRPKKETAA